MIDSLLTHYEVLVDIRKYLIKKGQARYRGKVIDTKLGEAKDTFDKCSQIFLLLEKGKDVKLSSAINIFQNIKEVYEEINKLCIFPIQSDLGKMEFDLKVACSLIPVMDGVENTTKRLIDSAEMYADMIDDKVGGWSLKLPVKEKKVVTEKIPVLIILVSVPGTNL